MISTRTHLLSYLKPTISLSLLESHLSRCQGPALFLQIHAQSAVSGLLDDAFAASRLVAFASDSAFLPLDYPFRLVHHIKKPNPFSWNCAMKASVRRNRAQFCLPLYKSMLRRDSLADNYTYPILAHACACRNEEMEGRQVHAHAAKFGFGADVYVANTLIHMYSVCGNPEDARRVFDASPVWDSVSWNSILAAYVQAGDVNEAVWVFSQMPEQSTIAANSMIALLGRSGLVADAQKLFGEVRWKDIVTWTAMISCYERSAMFAEALQMFSDMRRQESSVDEALMVSIISACAQSEVIRNGELIHGLVVRAGLGSRVNVQNALVHMYARCCDVTAARKSFDWTDCLDQISWNSMVSGYLRNGLADDAKTLFDAMPCKDTVSWSTMISGYARQNRSSEALELFNNMLEQGIEPDEITLVSVLSACSNLSALEQGKWIHEYIVYHGYRLTVVVGTALIDMYMKCGCLEDALEVFDAMEEKGTSSWNAVILGLAMNGLVTKSLQKFSEMEGRGDVPNEITFVGVLGACRHAGLVDEGRRFFKLMQQKYGIVPNIKHYGCMVDLLGRAGYIREAEDLIESMPCLPDAPTWGALLGACRKHGQNEIGERVGRKLVELEPQHDGFHALLSNIYASEGMWDNVKDLRGSMKQRHVAKIQGFSVVESHHCS